MGRGATPDDLTCFPFLDVLLRGLILAAQATAVGGVCFLLLVARAPGPTAPRSLLLIAAAAVTLALGQALALGNELFVLLHEAAWPLRAALDTLYVQVSVVRIAAGLALAGVRPRAAPRADGPSRLWPAVVALAAVLVVAAPWTSHAAARLDSARAAAAARRRPPARRRGVDRRPRAPDRGRVPARRSALAGGPAPAVLEPRAGRRRGPGGRGRGPHAGTTPPDQTAIFGTAYGLMVLTKVAILGGLLVLGALNSRAIRRMDGAPEADQLTLRRFVEVEVGLGLTVLFAAASLTSLPPAVDLTHDRATLAEVATRFTPRMPRAALALDLRDADRRSAGARATTPIAPGPSSTTTCPGSWSSPWACWPCCTPPAGPAGRGTGRSSSWGWPPS